MTPPADEPLPPDPAAAVAALPAGAWGVGVSGGADSVALLALLHGRAQRAGDLRLHVVHLDHQTRGDASTVDAGFVRDLAAGRGIPCTVARRDEVEAGLVRGDLTPNPSARYRAARLALFRDVVATHALAGVVLAHHADDQAETVLHRLLRGSGYAGLAGMDPIADLGGLRVARPLLGVRRAALRAYLEGIGQPWREDASNASDQYARNRLRRVLADRPALTDALLTLAATCRALRDWTRQTAPDLPAAFPVDAVAGLPPLLARESLRRWLIARGVPAAELGRTPAAIDRLLQMATDAASPHRQAFPGRVAVRRRAGLIFVDE